MEVQDQIDKFKQFIEINYINKILENIKKEHQSVSIEFNELAVFEPDLAELLLENPEDTLRAAEIAIEGIDLGLDEEKKIKVRFMNLPDEQKFFIRNIRSKHLGKFIEIEGIIRQK